MLNNKSCVVDFVRESIRYQHSPTSPHTVLLCALKRSRYVSLLTLLIMLQTSLASSQPLVNNRNKFVGCSITSVRSNFASYFNEVTPENAGKWGSVESSPGVYNWSALDNIYNYAISNGFPYKHHNLVWGQQQPSWITSLDSATQRAEVKKWIDTLGQRYPSVSFIDVVNEPLHASPPYMNALGGSGTTGWDWVVTAFQWARKAFFPGVKLILNDYNILQDNNVTTIYIRLIDTLRVRGLIDAIGIQGHYFEFKGSGYTYPTATLKSNLDRIAALGLPIYISEFDINEPNDNTQLQNYQTYFPLFWENPGVKGITLWGYVQYDIWKTDAYLLRADGSERPSVPWLRIYLATPTALSPLGSTNEPRNTFLVWRRSTPATSYRVQVANDSLFSSVVADSTIADTLLQVKVLAANTKFYWHVRSVNNNGASVYAVTASFTTGQIVGIITNLADIPSEFRLMQNYPNPFNPSTTIEYDLPVTSHVTLTISDVLGRVVATLVDQVQPASRYTIQWNASATSSGVYFYRLNACSEDGSKTTALVKKLVLMK